MSFVASARILLTRGKHYYGDYEELSTTDYIIPMKAKPSDISFLERVDNDINWVAGEKLDGYRELWYIGARSSELLSSAGNSHVDRVPQFKIGIPELAGAVFDCEGLSPTRRLEDNASCFKAGPYSSIPWQQQNGLASLHIFDILRANGTDMIDIPFKARRYELERAWRWLEQYRLPIILERLVMTNKVAYYNSIIARSQIEGHEGIILKDMDALYQPGKRGNAWLKVKRKEVLECTITGCLPGVGKFDGLIGSLLFVCDRAEGSTSGMNDSLREDMTAAFNTKYLGHKCLIECQEVTDRSSLRHPRFIKMLD